MNIAIFVSNNSFNYKIFPRFYREFVEPRSKFKKTQSRPTKFIESPSHCSKNNLSKFSRNLTRVPSSNNLCNNFLTFISNAKFHPERITCHSLSLSLSTRKKRNEKEKETPMSRRHSRRIYGSRSNEREARVVFCIVLVISATRAPANLADTYNSTSLSRDPCTNRCTCSRNKIATTTPRIPFTPQRLEKSTGNLTVER